MENSTLMKLDEVCSRLHISVSTAYKLIKNNTLPAKKIGRKWLIKASDLESYIRQHPYIILVSAFICRFLSRIAVLTRYSY